MVALDLGLAVESPEEEESSGLEIRGLRIVLGLRATDRVATGPGGADSRLPVQQDLCISEPADTGARLVMQVSPGAVAPPGLRLFRGDIAGATIIEQTPTRLVSQGFELGMTQTPRTSAVLANGSGTALYTASYCNLIGVYAQVRMDIEFVGPASSVKTSRELDQPHRVHGDSESVRAIRLLRPPLDARGGSALRDFCGYLVHQTPLNSPTTLCHARPATSSLWRLSFFKRSERNRVSAR
jgi:hypothetical protein